MREATADAVKKVKERLGGKGTSPYYNEFQELYDKGDGTFKRVPLRLNAPREISAFEEDIALYCATVESELRRRFLEPELETFMQAACVLDHSSWPEYSPTGARFQTLGVAEVQALVDHWKTRFNLEGFDNFTDFKTAVSTNT
jgi:hypothetical protein